MGRAKRWIQAEIILVCVIWLTSAAFFFQSRIPVSDMVVVIELGEFHANSNGGIGELFYGTRETGFSQTYSIVDNIQEETNMIEFRLPEIDLGAAIFRLDPLMNDEAFSIRSMYLYCRGATLLYLAEEEFPGRVIGTENCVYDIESGQYICSGDDPILYLDEELGQLFIDLWSDYINLDRDRNLAIVVLMLSVFAMSGIALFLSREKRDPVRMTRGHLAAVIVAGFFAGIGLAAYYGIYYLVSYFGDVHVEDLLFYMNVPLDGTNVSTFYRAILAAGAALCVGFLLAFGSDWYLLRTGRQKGYPLWLGALGMASVGYALWIGYNHIDLATYLKYRNEKTSLYEDHYVDGRDVALSFPEEKRNLVYIFLESMETTYADQASGGAMGDDHIPELAELALGHVNFGEQLNGAYTLTGTTFTMGGIVAQTAGIPINTTVNSELSFMSQEYEGGYLLPGACTIGDILAEADYRQVFMAGSQGTFGGRAAYFKGHGGYEIIDYDSARENGWIPEDYYEWWGFEDEKLFAFAKDELLSLADSGQPFNLTMLTADTHFTDGYLCELCGRDYKEQYSNVIACASAQVYEFVTWMMEQEFYENTTIVIAGDHLTMDYGYIYRTGVQDFDRKVYVSIINPAGSCEDTAIERNYSTCDLFPTTLAALGVQIEGERLGLGVNLFSEVPTLLEQCGRMYLNQELMKYSDYYLEELAR